MDTKYTNQPWSCMNFDEQECQQQMVNNLQEQFNTIFDCVFVPAAAAAGQEGLLLTAHHSGHIRLYNWRQVCNKWLSQRHEQKHDISWKAHNAPVYATALLHFDGSHLLVTAGGDGLVKLWLLDSILKAAAAAAAAAAEDGGDCCLQASAEVLLPHLQNPLGISDGRQPAAQVLAVDQQHQQVFIGGDDGGIHAWQLPQLAAAVAALGQAKQSAAAAAALSLVAMPGHAAAVLGLDYCSTTHQLASAAEDGTVRVWDCASHSCVSIIHPNPVPSKDAPGPLIPLDQPQLLLKCARSPGNTCVRFDTGGNWLLIGNDEGYLVLWSVKINTAVAHTQCSAKSAAAVAAAAGDEAGGAASAAGDGGSSVTVPQVLLVAPSSIYMAGTDKQLHQYSFQLEHQHSFEVSAESVFGLAHEPGSGMLAVCGSRGCLDLVSEQGTNLGHVKPAGSVFLSAP